MDRQKVEWLVRSEVLLAIKKHTGQRLVPVGISNHHIHLSKQDLETLFGEGYSLSVLHPLSQPDQFAAKETVDLTGSKGQIKKLRVLGPVRGRTQAEITVTDAFTVGIRPLIRMSGDLEGAPGAVITGPKGQITIPECVIVAARHLHMSGREAEAYGLKDGDSVSLKAGGERALILDNVIVRSGSAHALELHLDTDEANAAHLNNGDLLEIL